MARNKRDGKGDSPQSADEFKERIAKVKPGWSWRRKVLFFAIVPLFLIILLLALFSAWFYYSTPSLSGRSLSIGLAPASVTVGLFHGETKNITIDVQVSRAYLCTASCEASLYDLASGELLKSAKIPLAQDEQTTQVTVVSPYAGKGQLLYRYVVACWQPQTFWCRDNSSALTSALIAADYDYREEEAALQQTLRATLQERVNQSYPYAIAFAQAKHIAAVAPQLLLAADRALLEDETKAFAAFNASLGEALTQWDNESYLLLKDSLPQDPTNSTQRLQAAISEYQRRKAAYNETARTLAASQTLLNEVQAFSNDSANAQLFQNISNQFLRVAYDDVDALAAAARVLNQRLAGERESLLESKVLYDASKILGKDYVRLDAYPQANLSLLPVACDELRTYALNNGSTLNVSYRSDLEAVGILNRMVLPFNKLLDEGDVYAAYFGASADIASCNALVRAANAQSDYLLRQLPMFEALALCSDQVNAMRRQVVDRNLSFGNPADSLAYVRLKPIDAAFPASADFTANDALSAIARCPAVYPKNTTFNETFEQIAADIAPPFEIEERTVAEHLPICCVFGKCQQCCNSQACLEQDFSYPVILLHGHMSNREFTPEYSMSIFDKLQERLHEEGYIGAGVLLPNSPAGAFGELGKSGSPVTIKATYYYDVYDQNGTMRNLPSNNESISVYARRLDTLISQAKFRTGKSKVNIIAHSMGGLVAREYIRVYGNSSVNQLILIGTPNYGIVGRVQKYCAYLGESAECADLQVNSSFLRTLNSKDTPARITMIRGTGCDGGDGVVLERNAYLPYAMNYLINGTCTDFAKTSLHTDLMDPDRYPQVYTLIKDALATH